MIYVGDTDESALAEAGPHFEVFRNRFLKKPLEMLLPPGYSSRESMKAIAMSKGSQTVEVDAKSAVDAGMFVCGSAKTVRETLITYAKEIGFGNLLVMLQFGTLPADLTLRNMRRFAEEVMPGVRLAAREFQGVEIAPL
jgi:alkanesulfonate monooxygenase SsuD/methylene tetrahydromethanopterin reductase-like flavin-dependent oxidoreductase (luciferase family)